MVTARRYREEGRQEGLQEGRQEGRQEGLQEGRQERDAEWLDWTRRRDAARAEGKEFNEPSPADKDRPSPQ